MWAEGVRGFKESARPQEELRPSLQGKENQCKHLRQTGFALIYLFIYKDFIYLFLERRKGREKERERNIDVGKKHHSVASRMCLDRGPEPTNPQPRHMP